MKNKLFIALTLAVGLSLFGCQPSNNAVNNPTTANTNKTANSTTNTNISTNSNTATNTNIAVSNANNSASMPGNANSASQNSVTSKKDDATETKADCTVKEDNAEFFVEATEKTVKLKKGTPVNVVSWDMHQGLYAVNAKIDGKWVRGEINYELINCPDEK